MSDIRALVVDDEPLARRGIRQLLVRHPDIMVVAECRNGKETLRALHTLAPDLVFLDVQMPGLGGFEVIRTWGVSRMPATVFVTAYEEFAVRAFEACALDYLVKPVGEDRFDAAMTRVRERIRMGDALALAARLTALLAAEDTRARGANPLHAPVPAGSLVVPTPTGKLILDPSEIDWIEARDYYACVHAGEQRYLIRESLGSLEKRLDAASFFRVHRGAIVRLGQMRELRTTSGGATVLLLRDGARVPVSRRRRERLAALLRRQLR